MKNDWILRIYTDGGCSGNQKAENIGGWGAILEFAHAQKEIYGNESNTTNNRMEMTALLEAFKAIRKENQKIHVFSDSSYLMECFRQRWYENWLKNGWKTSSKKPVENKELWELLLPYIKKHDISFFRVKGHVDINKSKNGLDKLYNDFIKWNGHEFSYDDFIYITKKNNRADELANIGIDELKKASKG